MIGDSGTPKKRSASSLTWRDMVTSPTVMLFFTFYAASSAANAGVSQFAVAALTEIYGISLASANLALTVYNDRLADRRAAGRLARRPHQTS